MTCIVGIETPDGVLIGGDSAGTGGYSQTIRADEKVWVSGEFVYGFTSSYRMGQLLRYKLHPPQAPYPDVNQADMDKYMTTDYIEAVRKVLKEGGYAKVENGVEKGGTFLVGWRGSLYGVYNDFQVARSVDGFAAVGSGEDIALGALEVLQDTEDNPRKAAELALEAAAKFNAAVAGPFTFAEVKK